MIRSLLHSLHSLLIYTCLFTHSNLFTHTHIFIHVNIPTYPPTHLLTYRHPFSRPPIYPSMPTSSYTHPKRLSHPPTYSHTPIHPLTGTSGIGLSKSVSRNKSRERVSSTAAVRFSSNGMHKTVSRFTGSSLSYISVFP